LLFGLGGFVGFLHKTETDAWKCFVVGISAPALITTALASRANAETTYLGFPSITTVALAAESDLSRIRPFEEKVQVLQPSSLVEGTIEQIKRGLFGDNPARAYIIVSVEKTLSDARKVAATVNLIIACSSDSKTKKLSAAVLEANTGPFVPTSSVNVVMVRLSPPTARKDILGTGVNVQGFVSTTQARAKYDLEDAADHGEYHSIKDQISEMIQSVPSSCNTAAAN
jgi:hypothetical protein